MVHQLLSRELDCSFACENVKHSALLYMYSIYSMVAPLHRRFVLETCYGLEALIRICT